ncbi:MAG: PspC domain-containing protein [Chloroflexota bacterium]|nr:MAG: hypothetical protein DIU68_06170 [Chloroflexota bacterium]
MQRSFTDRVLGGVCGGLAASLRLNAWLVRLLFIILALVSLGAFAALYLLLWWITPQESFVMQRRRGLPLVIALLLIAMTVAAWLARDAGTFVGPTGIDLFWPGVLLVLSLVFFLRQVRV